MIAEREDTKVNFERESRLVITTKARVFSAEGWKVVVTDGEGNEVDVAAFEKALAGGSTVAPAAQTEAAVG